MAKVFAVIESSSGALELLSWRSGAEFKRQGQSYLDEKFICIASAGDYINYGLYREPKQQEEEPVYGMKYALAFSVVKSQKEIDAHNMIHKAFVDLFNK